MIQAGVDLETIRRIGGWRDYKMLRRYLHVSDERVVRSIEKIVSKPEVYSVSIPTQEEKRSAG